MCEIGEKITGIENLPPGIYQILSDPRDKIRSLIVFGTVELQSPYYTNCVLYIPWAESFRKPIHLKSDSGWEKEEFLKLKDNYP